LAKNLIDVFQQLIILIGKKDGREHNVCFNLSPGQGLGFTPSKLLAWGLGTGFVTIVELVESAYGFLRTLIQKGFTRGRVS